ncbi:MAG: helix-turn-helix transcriptional regulator [Ferrovibrio sp.]|nr:helix-turn-helix transcriptional regulator [Ferrovibrio sp.]
MNETVVKRIQMAMDDRQMKPAELARLSGIPKTTLSSMFTRPNAEPNLENALRICKALRINAKWLATGQGRRDSGAKDLDQAEILEKFERLEPGVRDEILATIDRILAGDGPTCDEWAIRVAIAEQSELGIPPPPRGPGMLGYIAAMMPGRSGSGAKHER